MTPGRTPPGRSAPLYSVRPFAEGDEAALCALWQRCGLIVPHNDPRADIQQFRSSPSSEILIAVGDQEVVGSVCVGHDGHRGWLYYLAVEPALQRRGLARHLVQDAEQWLAERDLRKVQLMIRPNNEPVRAFYEAIGYGLTPRLVMARWLSEERTAPEAGATLEETLTTLEMRQRPAGHAPHPPPRIKLALMRAEEPPLAFYRFLYRTVGESWLWAERLALDDAALAAIIHDPRVAIYVLYLQGVPAGFAEFDLREAGQTELVRFGLMPEFLGRDLGRYLLRWVLDSVWDLEPGRIRTTISSLDSPAALALCQRSGFNPVAQEMRRFADPRKLGILPPDAGRGHDMASAVAHDSSSTSPFPPFS